MSSSNEELSKLGRKYYQKPNRKKVIWIFLLGCLIAGAAGVVFYVTSNRGTPSQNSAKQYPNDKIPSDEDIPSADCPIFGNYSKENTEISISGTLVTISNFGIEMEMAPQYAILVNGTELITLVMNDTSIMTPFIDEGYDGYVCVTGLKQGCKIIIAIGDTIEKGVCIPKDTRSSTMTTFISSTKASTLSQHVISTTTRNTSTTVSSKPSATTISTKTSTSSQSTKTTRSSTTTSSVTTTPIPRTTTKYILLVFFHFNDTSKPNTTLIPPSVTKAIDGHFGMTSTYNRSSYGKFWLTGFNRSGADYTDWLQAPFSVKQSCNFFDWCNSIVNKYNLASTKHDYYMFIPFDAPTCNFGGIAYQPGKWSMIKSIGYFQGITVPLHEHGHNLGFRHASTMNCTNAAKSQINVIGLAQNCVREEYGDSYSCMGGYPQVHHLNNYHRFQLGWLSFNNTNPAVLEVKTNGTYNISSIETTWSYDPSKPVLLILKLKTPFTNNLDIRNYDAYFLELHGSYPMSSTAFIKNPINGLSYKLAVFMRLVRMTVPDNPILIKNYLGKVGDYFHDNINGFNISLVQIVNQEMMTIKIEIF